MRCLHVISGLTTGGAERTLHNILSGGLAQRFDTTVLSLRDLGSMGPRIKELGVPVHTLDMGGGASGVGAPARLRRIVRSLDPDLIQGWMYHGNLAASFAARFSPRQPAVVWNIRHSLYGLKQESPLIRQIIRANRFLSRRVDGIIYNSAVSRQQHGRFGFDDRHAWDIPNGFDLSRLQPNQERGRYMRAELGLPSDALVTGHVARFHPMKDQVGFLRAAAQVADTLPAAYFLLVGRDVTADNPALRGIVPADLSERFVFTGERRDPERLMAAMDLLSTSSAWGEAFPNVLGEAMACGMPCVATDVGDSASIVGETGLIVPPRDTDALALAIMDLLNKNSDERAALGIAARRRIQERYSIEHVVDKYTNLYRDVQR